MDTPSSKPMMWSKILLEESEFYSKIYDIFNNLIDPRLIHIDKQLTQE